LGTDRFIYSDTEGVDNLALHGSQCFRNFHSMLF
jgi:hypothetical protein